MPTAIQAAIRNLTFNETVDGELCGEVARQILGGEATPSQIGAFLVGMRIRGENVGQLTGFVRVMREFATPMEVDDPDGIVDIVGTGGVADRMINVSTASSIIAAGAGARVVKHGNRAVTGTPGSGSADVFTALGVKIDCPPEVSACALKECGLAFCFAPAYHGAMRHAGPTRKEIGVRSMMNLLGPLANPARAGRFVIGVSEPALTRTFAEVLRNLGCKRAMVVHGEDGLDEITMTAPTLVSELNDGEIHDWTLDPRALGLELAPPKALEGGESAEERAETIRNIIVGEDTGPRRDIIALNVAAALTVSDLVKDLAQGLELAVNSMANGAAAKALECFAAITNGK